MNEQYERLKAEVNNTCGYCACCKPLEKKKGKGVCKNERSDSYDDYVSMTERCPDFIGREDDGYITRNC